MDKQGRVEVLILEANLFALDGLPRCNSFCTCVVAGKEDTGVIRTPVQEDSLEPEWEHKGTLEGCFPGCQLQFAVLREPAPAAPPELVGTVNLQADSFASSSFEGGLDLVAADGSAAGTLTVRAQYLPSEDCPKCGATFPPDRTTCSNCGYRRPMPESGRTSTSPTAMRYLEAESRQQAPISPSAAAAGTAPGPKDLTTAPSRRRVVVPEATEPEFSSEDPGKHVPSTDQRPAPLQLRSLETGHTHRLASYTKVGRGGGLLDGKVDLILTNPGTSDISRYHAVIKAWPGAEPSLWLARVYDVTGPNRCGAGKAPGGGHAGGGITVDGEPVPHDIGTALEPGSVIRFGVNEFWVLERAIMHQRSPLAEIACVQARANTLEDPNVVRELQVPSVACNSALHRCNDWVSFVAVVLESRNEPDEPPCADSIEVQDERGKPLCRYELYTFDEQEAFDVSVILRHVNLGRTIRMRLSSEPALLAPILRSLEESDSKLEEIYRERSEALNSF